MVGFFSTRSCVYSNWGMPRAAAVLVPLLCLALQAPPALPFVAIPARLQHVQQRPGVSADARRAQQQPACGGRACEERGAVRWLLGLSSAVVLGSAVALPEDAVAFYQPTRTSLDAALQSTGRRVRGEDECPQVINRLPRPRTVGVSRVRGAGRDSICPGVVLEREAGVFPGGSDAVATAMAASLGDYTWEGLTEGGGGEVKLHEVLPTISHKSRAEISMPVNMVLAFVASALSTLVVHPVDTLKARLQSGRQVERLRTRPSARARDAAGATAARSLVLTHTRAPACRARHRGYPSSPDCGACTRALEPTSRGRDPVTRCISRFSSR